MPNKVTGWGGMVLTITNPSQPTITTTRILRYEIRQDGFKFYADSNRTAIRLFDLLGLNTATGKGFLTLEALPATPQASFRTVTLTYTAEKLTLKVEQTDIFAQRANIYFKALNLQFTELKATPGVTVNGGVTAVLCEQEIPLIAKFSDDSTLVLHKPASATATLSIDPTGTYTITTLEVAAPATKWAGLQALYTFAESSGTTVLDVSGVGTPLDLTVRDAAAIRWIPGGLAIDNATIINSSVAATKVLQACQTSNEITIEAWVKPAKTDQGSPARIVTMSGDRENRNFALQQGVWRTDHLDPEVYAARLRTTFTDNSGESPIDIPIGVFKTDPVHLVYTRDVDGNARLYVNGIEQMQIQVGGNFDTWDSGYQMVLANEFTNDRAWLGEYYLVAVYNRALPPEQVTQNLYPLITTTGNLTLATVPAPLQILTGVRLDHRLQTSDAAERSILSYQPTAALAIVPDFELAQVNFTWEKLPKMAWAFTGTLTLRLWGNSLDAVAHFIASGTQWVLSLLKPDTTATTLLLDGLGSIDLTQLGLYTTITNPPNWELRTDGQVNLPEIPPPLNGPFPAQLKIGNGPLQLHLNPAVPLTLVESLTFTEVNLNFFRSAASWETQGTVSLRFLDQTLPLSAKFGGDGAARGFILDWVADPANPSPFADAVGRWVLSRLSLQPIVPAANPWWQLTVNGTVALATSQNTAAGVMALALTGQVIGDRTDLAKPTYLEGNSLLQQFSDLPIFTGKIELRGDHFFLPGRLTFFPVESPLQLNGAARIEIDPNRRVNFQTPAEFSLPNVQLLDPTLTLSNGQLSLRGRWLGETLALTAFQRGQQLLWQGETTWQLPFGLTLGALYEPQTQIKLADQVKVCQEAGCLQIMSATLPLEWSAAGFWTQVKGAFQWQDQTRSLHNLVVPTFQLFTAPLTRNELLGTIVQEIRANANEIFAPEFKHESDYFLITQDSQPVLYYGQRSVAPTTHTTELPLVLGAAATVTDSKSPPVFQLVQTATTCTLTINGAAMGLEEAYRSFLANLATLESQSGKVLPGAVPLIKARIAERVPMSLDRSLFYHYGFEPSQGFVDLLAGMRLRVDYQNFQELPVRSGVTTKGFAGSGSSYYSINSYLQPVTNGLPIPLLGFDAFTTKLQLGIGADASKDGGGGILDFQKVGFRQPYYRLFYPSQFAGPGVPSGVERVITIVGAANSAELQAATQQYLDNNGVINTTNIRVSCFFRGRVVVVPEIAVLVQEQPVYVPVGTTVRQLIERYAGMPACFASQDLRQFQGTLRPRRLVHEGVDSVPGYKFLHVADYQRSDRLDSFDLPVIKGDRFYF